MEVEQLTHTNLQKFCRLCLRSLGCISYNIQEHNLGATLKLYTAIDLGEEEAAFPKSLCQLCYASLYSFRQFQDVALQSTRVLYELMGRAQHASEIVTEIEEAAFGSAEHSKTDFDRQVLGIRELSTTGYVEHTNSTTVNIKTECTEFAIDRNDHNSTGATMNSTDPLFPLVQDHAIKTEPVECLLPNEPSLPSITEVYSEFALPAVVKSEIDSEYDEDDSIADDADDEEHALCNGAANNWTPTLDNLSSPTSSNSAARRKDRSKKTLKCPLCAKQVYKQVYLDAHIRSVHEGYEKPFVCGECLKGFTRYNQLHVHIQTKHQKTLEKHRQVAHTSDDPPFPMDLQDVIERQQIQLSREVKMHHICHLCCKKYSSKRALGEHLKRHAQIKEYVCKVCGTAKVTRTELQTHMRTHEPNLEKFKCTICPQEFNHKNAISRHVRVVHEGQRRYSCNFCSKRFGTRNAQVCHERLHTGERPYSCKSCTKTFAQVDALKSHMKSHDTNLRKHMCSYCARRFITRKNLVDHESRHRSNKPHICDVCNRGYFQQADLVKHRKAHEEVIVAKVEA